MLQNIKILKAESEMILTAGFDTEKLNSLSPTQY